MTDSTNASNVARESRELRAYVNERGVSVAAGSIALDAVHAFSPELAAQVASGAARLTDSRGLPLEATAPVHGGLIVRVLPLRARAQAANPGEGE
jgi:hypothetical protein